MTEVFFFSATGNSYWAAARASEKLGGKLSCIPSANGETEADRVLIVSPVYAFGLPVPAADFIARLKTGAPVWVLLTYGGAGFGADRAAYEACKKAGLDVRGVFMLKMVENFTVFATVPKWYSSRALKKAPAALEKILAKIEAGESAEPKRKKGGREDSDSMREGWRKMGARLHADGRCVKCGKCARICPAGNITMGEDGPVFGDACVACLACYHRCPAHAVRFG
ncbi:MAG: EFR1 family ferrodoxin, partial [Clostridia bacterium]|nr:EFR1 family ferrodoxin [Clostridia bacterium]